MQSLVEIGSEMWICIRYRQTKRNKNPFQLYHGSTNIKVQRSVQSRRDPDSRQGWRHCMCDRTQGLKDPGSCGSEFPRKFL